MSIPDYSVTVNASAAGPGSNGTVKVRVAQSVGPIPINTSASVNPVIVYDADYNNMINKPSINSVVLEGNLTSEDLGITTQFPDEGSVGDILMKTTDANDGVAWVTPASSAEQDNTRPITAAAVYTEIGNINSLLATI